MLSDANRDAHRDANRQESEQTPGASKSQVSQAQDDASDRAQAPTPNHPSAAPAPQTPPPAPVSLPTAEDSADDAYLFRLMNEEDDTPVMPPPLPSAPASATPAQAAPAPHARVIQQRISPTLERHELLRGAKLGEKYVRVKHPEAGFFRRQAADELEVTVPAPEPRSEAERLLRSSRTALFGAPLTTAQQAFERLTKVKALAVLSSDAISSVAYATEASLAILITAGLGALRFNPGISIAITLLMVVVGASYFQTIHAYPQGGGS